MIASIYMKIDEREREWVNANIYYIHQERIHAFIKETFLMLFILGINPFIIFFVWNEEKMLMRSHSIDNLSSLLF